jgi:acyl-CoA reductase-like NAD-dependent aldehyde dehydrogenase
VTTGVVWPQTALSERTRLLAQLRQTIVDQLDHVVTALSKATFKPAMEAMLNEVIPTLELLKYYERHAAQILERDHRPTPRMFPRSRSYVDYHPRGTVLVLAPFNFPFQLALAPAISALTAGNKVILKMSEHRPLIGGLLRSLFQEAGYPEEAVRIVDGDATVAERLVREKPDLIFLTGGVNTGRRVMQLAAENLTPVILELGGKDPMIVFEDAPLERAVNAAVYGAFVNAGQVCVSVDRIYVQRSIFERFATALANEARSLKVGTDPDCAYGPLLSGERAASVRSIVRDALDRGATALTPIEINGAQMRPVVLQNVDATMRIWHEEVFGPVVSLVPFDDEPQAVALANDSKFGLNSSVWSADLARARRVASRLVTGNTAINDVIKNIGNPHLPFGGVKHSGIGVYHGPEGLRAFCRPQSVMVNTGRWKREPNWVPYSARRLMDLRILVQLAYSGASWAKRLKNILSLGRQRGKL